MDRERMLDMDGRLRPARQRSFLVLAAALVACGPWLGWWTLAPLFAAGVLFAIADKRMHTMRRPEYVMFAAWAGSEVIIAISVRSEEHTSELQSRQYLVCRLLLEKKKKNR